MLPEFRFINCGGMEICLRAWGDANAAPVIMWHGLLRNGADHNSCARILAQKFNVLCPDSPGRGLSQWAEDPAQGYSSETLVKVATELTSNTGTEQCGWVGTSMGGLLGMHLAGGPLKEVISALVLVDIAPFVDAEAIARMAEEMSAPPSFPTFSEFREHLKERHRGFGDLSEETWHELALTSHRRQDDGRFTAAFDPAIVNTFLQESGGIDLWGDFERIECPILLLRGEHSRMLTEETAAEMCQRNPNCRTEVVEGCAHAPLLDTRHQIALISDFLS